MQLEDVFQFLYDVGSDALLVVVRGQQPGR